MNDQNNHIPILHSTQEEVEEPKLEELLPNHLPEQEIPKNRQWTDPEHILYILFLELNREKIKSKLIRRSNSFYKEMSQFVKTKSPVQCRSHNQKYEEKYKYPHRIIREEKEKLSPELYSEIQGKIRLKAVEASKLHSHCSRDTQEGDIKKKEDAKPKESVSCQTELQGTHLQFIMQNQISSHLPINRPPMEWYYPSWLLPPWNPCHMNSNFFY